MIDLEGTPCCNRSASRACISLLHSVFNCNMRPSLLNLCHQDMNMSGMSPSPSGETSQARLGTRSSNLSCFAHTPDGIVLLPRIEPQGSASHFQAKGRDGQWSGGIGKLVSVRRDISDERERPTFNVQPATLREVPSAGESIDSPDSAASNLQTKEMIADRQEELPCL